MIDYVVEFVGCGEAVIRRGESEALVDYPDDLGCAVTRIRPLDQVRLRGEPWLKNGALRCSPVEEGGD